MFVQHSQTLDLIKLYGNGGIMYSLNGKWKVFLNDNSEHTMILPGTLDENRIGFKDSGNNQWHPDATLGNETEVFKAGSTIATRFTRKYTYEGNAVITKILDYCPPENKRIFLDIERGRCIDLYVDGNKVPNFVPPSISTPHIFEVTGMLTGHNEIKINSDNSYPGLPHDAILYSSAATDETQTNWNGILGYFRLREEEKAFISSVRVYPCEKKLTINVEISSDSFYMGDLFIDSDALLKQKRISAALVKGKNTIRIEDVELKEDISLWDEYEGNLYQLIVRLELTDFTDEKQVRFGIRTFGNNGKGRLSLNGRTIFIRSEANCAVYPENGHTPMTVSEWKKILKLYKSYGINFVRFHSHCPPEAAFVAADELGMLMQPELSHWNPKDAFETEESFEYYKTELTQIILTLANHPSFVMLTLGNELQASEKGHERMRILLNIAKELDNTRLYAEGSNVHYGEQECEPDSDFYTSQKYLGTELRGTFSDMEGHINNQYPNTKTNYNAAIKRIREQYQKPIFSFEAGQYEILPDFDELDDFKGITIPDNLKLIQNKVIENGLCKDWKKYVEATGEIALLSYREEIEAAMRTDDLSGISLLGLQDFPGQGTALVGMLNSHMQPKPYNFAKAERFECFFRAQLPLLLLSKYTYEWDECIEADVIIANYGKIDITGELEYKLISVAKNAVVSNDIHNVTDLISADNDISVIKTDAISEEKGLAINLEITSEKPSLDSNMFEDIILEGKISETVCMIGKNTYIGTIKIPLSKISIDRLPAKFMLEIKIADIFNSYPVWIYPKNEPVCPVNIYETKVLDNRACEILENGGTVYLSPDSTKEQLPNSIKAQFTTDFWSVGTFPTQEGGMGQYIDTTHPIFNKFPTEFHTNWQWWIMANQRAFILPKEIKSIITEMDSYAYMRNMGQLFECRCGNGKLMVSSLGLQNLKQYPEARALLASVYEYMASTEFEPEQEVDMKDIKKLVM